MGKVIGITTVLCYGGALLLAAIGVWILSSAGVPPNPGWILVSGSALLAISGVAIQTLLKDQQEALTQRQSQVSLLEAQMAQHRSAVDSLADGLETAIFICDPKASVLYANKRAQELFRFGDPVGRTLLAVTLSYELEQLVLAAVRTREPQNVEMNFTYPEDRVALAKAWPQEGGGSDRVFVSVYDISGLRRLERIRKDFVSNVSHELRTPLMIIRSMAETMLDEPENATPQTGKYLNKIISEVDRLTEMSSDLLVLSTAESNPVEKRPIDVAEIFKSGVSQLQERATDKGLKLQYIGPAKAVVLANGEQIRQVALNLLMNSINYSNEGEIKAILETSPKEITVVVEDTGIGIASEHLPRIFERFYRVDKARARSSGGTGLGLSIVKHIVEAHGGKVSVESALNEGSKFVVRLPVGMPLEEEQTSATAS